MQEEPQSRESSDGPPQQESQGYQVTQDEDALQTVEGMGLYGKNNKVQVGFVDNVLEN